MTTDPTPLQERIAEALYYDQHPEGRHRSEWPAAVYPDTVHEYRDLAAAVLPIIAAEVRKAQADALRQAADEDSETLYSVAGWEMQAVEADELRRRAADIETED